jgi:hypothetical protein
VRPAALSDPWPPNKINAAGLTNPLIWTALTLSRPFGTEFVSGLLTPGLQPARNGLKTDTAKTFPVLQPPSIN